MSTYTGPETDEQRAERRQRNAAEDARREVSGVIDRGAMAYEMYGRRHARSKEPSMSAKPTDLQMTEDAFAVYVETGLMPRQLAEQRDKFKWQVRDTCARAEKAEAERAELVAAGERVTAAFRALGQPASLIANVSALKAECEAAMTALDAALAKVRGGES